jgi:hypothetical protein
MIYWLFNKHSVIISQPTISHLLKRRGWSRKEIRRISLNCSEELRWSYIEDIWQFTANNMVFLDESIFNEKTGWRHHAYAPIGNEARYNANIL